VFGVLHILLEQVCVCCCRCVTHCAGTGLCVPLSVCYTLCWNRSVCAVVGVLHIVLEQACVCCCQCVAHGAGTGLCVLLSTNRALFLRNRTQGSQCTYNVTLRRVRANHCCSGKAMSITYSECGSVALGLQHAKHMRRIILPSAACPAVQYFFHIIS